MPEVPKKEVRPSDEARVSALRDLKILDTPQEERFDRITEELAESLGAPMAYISMIDDERQWLKSEVGGLDKEIPREDSFCNFTIQQDEPLVVPDAPADERFADLPFVTGDSQVRFYAGVPIKGPTGETIGTVCVADSESRELSPEQLETLKDYAGKVQAETNAPPMVFVSYAHEDEGWKDRLKTHCAVLERQGLLDVWEDRRLAAGAEWEAEIRDAMERAKVAVLLVSADFLTSDFIANEEVPRLLERRDREGLHIIPILMKPCCWDSVEWLARLNLKPNDGNPVAAFEEHQIDTALAELAGEIGSAVRRLGATPPTEEAPAAQEPTAAAPAPSAPQTPPKEADPASEPSDSLNTLGKYTGLALLWHNDGGSLYRARDESLDREVSLWTLPADLSADPERLTRFKDQARMTASLRHPNIALLHSLEESDGVPFLVLEPLDGAPLTEYLATSAPELDVALGMGLDLASALAAVHEHGVALRNLNTANCLVSTEGQIQLVDFGIAKTISNTAASTTMSVAFSVDAQLAGDAVFASPERLRHQPVDKRSDVFCYGAILWTILTGKLPFVGETAIDTMFEIIQQDPDWDRLPSALPQPVAEILRRCLEKDPGERFDDLEIVHRDLAAALKPQAQA